MSVAVGGLALERALFLARVADIAGAASLDAARGSDAAFDPRIVAARPHPGAIASAGNLRELLTGSAIRESHRRCGQVQDNYALRCMPQVHGAARDALTAPAAKKITSNVVPTDRRFWFTHTPKDSTFAGFKTVTDSRLGFDQARLG